MIYVNCPYCGIYMTDDGGLSGQMVMCPTCQGQFIMPGAQQGFPIAAGSPPVIDPAPSHSKYNRRDDADDTFNDPAKNPGLAAVLSFFYMGLGQIYNGQIAKGLVLCFVPILVSGFVIAAYFGVGISMVASASNEAENIERLTIVISGERHYLDELPESEFERLPPNIHREAKRQLARYERRVDQAQNRNATRGAAWLFGSALVPLVIGLAIFGTWIFGIFDAYSTAERINKSARRRRR